MPTGSTCGIKSGLFFCSVSRRSVRRRVPNQAACGAAEHSESQHRRARRALLGRLLGLLRRAAAASSSKSSARPAVLRAICAGTVVTEEARAEGPDRQPHGLPGHFFEAALEPHPQGSRREAAAGFSRCPGGRWCAAKNVLFTMVNTDPACPGARACRPRPTPGGEPHDRPRPTRGARKRSSSGLPDHRLRDLAHAHFKLHDDLLAASPPSSSAASLATASQSAESAAVDSTLSSSR